MGRKKVPREKTTKYKILRKVIEALANDTIKRLKYSEIAKLVKLSVARIRNIFPRKNILFREIFLELVHVMETKIKKTNSFFFILQTYYEDEIIIKAIRGLLKREPFYYLSDILAEVIIAISGHSSQDSGYGLKVMLANSLAENFLKIAVEKLSFTDLLTLHRSIGGCYYILFKDTQIVHYDNFDDYY